MMTLGDQGKQAPANWLYPEYFARSQSSACLEHHHLDDVDQLYLYKQDEHYM